MSARSRRVLPPRKPYKPNEEDGQHKGYTPAFRTRKAPKAYWRRKPEGYGTPGARPVVQEPFYFPWED